MSIVTQSTAGVQSFSATVAAIDGTFRWRFCYLRRRQDEWEVCFVTETKGIGGITVRSYALIVPPETLDSFLRFAAAVYRRHSIRLGTPTWSSPSAWTRRLMRLLGREDW